jgi:hypothetical protein
MTVNIVKQVTKATDLEQLREIANRVIGQPCWRASLSYGDELNLHIGARIPYSQKSLAGKEKGEWILGTRGTPWKLDSLSETLTISEDTPEVIKQKAHAIEGTTITSFETSYPELALTITFDNGCKLALMPSPEDDFDLPYWEMFTPHGMILKVGPSTMWSYTRSDN